MARQQGAKSRKTAVGGDNLGTKYDSLGRPSVVAEGWLYSDESILSSNHPGPPYHSGGPMFLTRTKLSRRNSSSYFGSVAGGSKKNAYEGKFRGGYVPNAVPIPISYNLDALGTEGVTRTLPTSPSAGLAVFLGELRDFPGMIRQTERFFFNLMKSGKALSRKNVSIREALGHLSNPVTAAEDYLNLQFGWVPFVRDLEAFVKTGKNLDVRVAQLKRNNMGKQVKRSRVLRGWNYSTLAEATVNNSLSPMMTPSVHSFLYDTGSACSTRTRTVEHYGKVWFKATYSYYSPEIASMPDWYLKADILGLRLDPAVIYQLTPWSWLADWFTTMGPLVTNAVEFARHHIVMHHGYTMQHAYTKHTVIDTQKMRTGYGAGAGSPTAQMTTEMQCLFETKQRVAANPFGFGVNWDSLSGYQLSILAALGITRGKRDG